MWLTTTIPLLTFVVFAHHCTGQCEVWPSETLDSSTNDALASSCISVRPSMTVESTETQQSSSDTMDMEFSLDDVLLETPTEDISVISVDSFMIVSSSPGVALDQSSLIASSSPSPGVFTSSDDISTSSLLPTPTPIPSANTTVIPSLVTSSLFSESLTFSSVLDSTLLGTSSTPTPITAITSTSLDQISPSLALPSMTPADTTVIPSLVTSSLFSKSLTFSSVLDSALLGTSSTPTPITAITSTSLDQISPSLALPSMTPVVSARTEMHTVSYTSQIPELSSATQNQDTQTFLLSTSEVQTVSSSFSSISPEVFSLSPTLTFSTVVQPTSSFTTMEQPSTTLSSFLVASPPSSTTTSNVSFVNSSLPTITAPTTQPLSMTPPITSFLPLTASFLPLTTSFLPLTTSFLPTTAFSPPTTSLPLTSTFLPPPTTSLPLPTTSLPSPTTSLPSPTTSLPQPSTSSTTTGAENGTSRSIIDLLTVPGIAAAAVGVALIIILSCILCCCCCVGCHRSRSKKRVEFRDSGFGYENKNATEMYSVPNGGVSGISYSHGSGLDIPAHHHYESAADVNAYLDRGAEFTYNGDHSQFHGSQPTMNHHSQSLHQSQPIHQSQSINQSQAYHHHHSQASALTDVFQKSTLPELSPMSYSLTANPMQSENFYLNALPTSNVSLREPTMFALSLQQEESKSHQGSRLSITGSKTSIHNSIHGSRPSVYGSKASNLHGSRPLVYNSGTSRESLLGIREGGGKEHIIDDEADMAQPSPLLGHRVSSPYLPPNSSTDNIELPTRDSPCPRASTALVLTRGKKDFASLTCIFDDPGRSITSPSRSPLESPVNSELEGSTPTHRGLSKRKDLSSLTSLDFMSAPSSGKESRGGTIIEEEESSQSSKVNSEKAKEESPVIKKSRSKHRSRLEKLTSLDYIRQSFRLKKKKVSFEQSPEATPKAVARKTSLLRGKHQGTIITNEQAHSHHDNEPAGPEREQSKLEWRQGRRNSSTSTDVFSPTENIARSMFVQHHHHAFPDPHAAMAMGYVAQLSQPNYYLPQHIGGATAPGMPMHPHVYAHAAQLSQQFYASQLSQSYPYQPSFHVPIGDPFGRNLPREAPPSGGRADPRYHEVITPDYSDITTPEHDLSRRQRKISSSEDEYELRDAYKRQDGRPNKYADPRDTSPTHDSPDEDLDMSSFTEGMAGMRPEYNNGYLNSAYLRDDLDLVGSPQRYGSGYRSANPSRGRHPDQLPSDTGEEAGSVRYATPMMGHIPEDMYQNSISVDDPPNSEFYSPSHHQQDPSLNHPRMQRRRSDISDNGERKFSNGSNTGGSSGSGGGGGKTRVSWNSTITTYDPDEDNKPELSRL